MKSRVKYQSKCIHSGLEQIQEKKVSKDLSMVLKRLGDTDTLQNVKAENQSIASFCEQR